MKIQQLLEASVIRTLIIIFMAEAWPHPTMLVSHLHLIKISNKITSKTCFLFHI